MPGHQGEQRALRLRLQGILRPGELPVQQGQRQMSSKSAGEGKSWPILRPVDGHTLKNHAERKRRRNSYRVYFALCNSWPVCSILRRDGADGGLARVLLSFKYVEFMRLRHCAMSKKRKIEEFDAVAVRSEFHSFCFLGDERIRVNVIAPILGLKFTNFAKQHALSCPSVRFASIQFHVQSSV